MSALGFIHKVYLGKAHPVFSELLKIDSVGRAYRTRHNSRRNTNQFQEYRGKTDYFNRSLYASVRVYNVLPQHVVDLKSVSAFQRALSKMAQASLKSSSKIWKQLFSNHH